MVLLKVVAAPIIPLGVGDLPCLIGTQENFAHIPRCRPSCVAKNTRLELERWYTQFLGNPPTWSRGTL